MSISDPRRPPSENEQNTLQIIQENGISHSHSNKYSALYIPQKISKPMLRVKQINLCLCILNTQNFLFHSGLLAFYIE